MSKGEWDRRRGTTKEPWQPEYREDVRAVSGESWWTLGKVLWYFVIPVVVLVVVVGGIAAALNLASQPGRIIAKTADADNVIYNYEWFKRQHEQIAAMTEQAANAEAQATAYGARMDAGKASGYQAEAEYARLQAVLAGLRNQRRNYVAEYNARAKMVNRSLFMGRDLPSEER